MTKKVKKSQKMTQKHTKTVKMSATADKSGKKQKITVSNEKGTEREPNSTIRHPTAQNQEQK